MGSGRNLNWFWKRWFFDEGVPDLAIRSVNKRGGNYEIVIESKGTKPVPIDLDIEFVDANLWRKEHWNVGVWESGNNTVTVTVPADNNISKISLGSLYVPDINKADNIYQNNRTSAKP
jgi:hypothetical protein